MSAVRRWSVNPGQILEFVTVHDDEGDSDDLDTNYFNR